MKGGAFRDWDLSIVGSRITLRMYKSDSVPALIPIESSLGV